MEARNRSESPIPMDFATCLSNVDDGSVTIRRNVILGLVGLIFFGLSLLGLISMVIVGLLEHRLRDVDIDGWGAVGGGIVLLGLVTFLAARSLLRPSIHFNARSNVLEIGRGKRLREIPFSSISQVSVGQKWKAGDTGARVGIQVTLDSGEGVKLGTVSGSGAEERAAEISERVARVTGATARP